MAALAFWVAPTEPLGAADPPGFEPRGLDVPGRPVQAFAFEEEPGGRAEGLGVVSVEGMPPSETRHLTLFDDFDSTPRKLVVDDDVIALDVVDVDPAPGSEIVLLEPRRLRILDASGRPLRNIALPADAALPARTRQVSQLDFVQPWNGDGAPRALVPASDGFVVMSLGSDGGRRRYQVPVDATYETWPLAHPLSRGFLHTEFTWPRVALADDDGDGKTDLFAATRFHLRVFRGGDPSPEPSRTAAFAPFTFEEERRHYANLLRTMAGDLDGDGLADIAVHRTVGTLLGSRSHAAFHHNRGQGADPSAPPDSELEVKDAFGTIGLVDIDGDGRLEVLETSVPFGLVQLARIMTRSRAEVQLRVFTFPERGLASPVLTWEEDITIPFDFGTARATTLLPTTEGDWNGDGRQDLLYGDPSGRARIRLGEASEAGPRFGREVARFEVPPAELGVAVDLDDDGLDDLVTWDEVDRDGSVHAARNLGRLPGTRPQVAPAP